MEAVTSLIEERDPPPCSLVTLISLGQLAYAYEPEMQDQYLSPSMWPQVSIEDYRRWGPWLWEHNPTVLGYGIPPVGSGRIAIDDCEGMATNETAWRRLERRRLGESDLAPWEQFNLVEEHMRRGRITGWHAEAAMMIPIGQRHIAEVPWPKHGYWWGNPKSPSGHRRVAATDLAWFGGMPRSDVGLFDRSQVLLVSP